MNAPSKAIILAAGFGVRMQPITHAVPKPLLPFWGRPAIEHILDMLKAWGVREVLINLHHGAACMVDHLRRRSPDSLHIALSFEAQILGTGGAAVRGSWFLDESSPFWIVNADIAVQGLCPGPFIAALQRPRTLAALWLRGGAGPQTVTCRTGLITSFHAREPGGARTYTFAGLHLVNPRVLRFLPDSGPSSIIEAYERAIRQRFRIRGVLVPRAFWADLGTARAFLDAHRAAWDLRNSSLPGSAYVSAEQRRRQRRLRAGGVRTTGFVALGDRISFRGSGTISDSVLFDGTSLTGPFEIDEAVVGPSAPLSGRLSDAVAVRAADGGRAAVQAILERIGWPADNTLLIPLPPRGSARTFTRVLCGSRSAILIEYTPERPENALYASHARFLRLIGVPVPRVLCHDARAGCLLMEDAGQTSLTDIVRRGARPDVRDAYRAVIPGIAQLHRRGAPCARRQRVSLCEPFGPSLYRWEHDLCVTHLLQRRLRLDPGHIAGIRSELARNARRLDGEPGVLVHRDFQSSNVLFGDRGPMFIDFQGMRIGPAVYDLASWLCDPYAMLDSGLQLELVSAYARAAERDAAGLVRTFWPAAIQRLVQALGAYARLASLPGMAGFARHIPAGLDMLDRALQFVDPMPRTRAWVACLKKGEGS